MVYLYKLMIHIANFLYGGAVYIMKGYISL